MPNWKQEINRLLENLRIDPAREASIVEELNQHLEDRYEELLLAGNSESDARRTVLEELEGSELLATALPPAMRNSANSAPPPAALLSGNLLNDLLRDVRYGLRSMGKAPAFTFFAVLTLALGIGASTTVFTVVNTLLLHPLPVRDPPAWSACMRRTSKPTPSPAVCSPSRTRTSRTIRPGTLFSPISAASLRRWS